MVSINKVILAGRLVKDPELSLTKNGKSYTNISLAIKEKDEVLFINRITFWERMAEVIVEYTHKGSVVLVEGRLKKNEYETQGGEKRITLDVVGHQIHFLDEKKSSEPKPAKPKQNKINVSEYPSDENIPF